MPDTEADASQDQRAIAVARIPSGVAILTARYESDSTGMLASWIQQASFSPLMVSVCVKRGRPIESLIDRANSFVLNVLGEDPKEMFKHFGRGFAPGQPAFTGVESRVTDYGVRLDAAIASMECRLVSKTEAGDHTLLLGEVVDGDGDATVRPFVHLRKTATGY